MGPSLLAYWVSQPSTGQSVKICVGYVWVFSMDRLQPRDGLVEARIAAMSKLLKEMDTLNTFIYELLKVVCRSWNIGYIYRAYRDNVVRWRLTDTCRRH